MTCPHCQDALDRTEAFDAESVSPGPGCLTLCATCGGLAVFTEDMGLRAASRADLRDLAPHDIVRLVVAKRWILATHVARAASLN